MKTKKFKETEIGMIPEDWEVKEVGDLIKHKKGCAFKSQWFQDSGKRIVKVSDFNADSIDTSKTLFMDEEKAKEFSDFEIHDGDIIIATVGSWPNNPASIVGKVIKVPKKADGSLLNQNAVILRTKNSDRLNQEFLYHRLRTKDFSHHVISGAQGSANQASITLRDIFTFEFGVPEIKEQERIAKVFSNINRKLLVNQQTNKSLEEISQAIFKRWFIDFEFPNEKGEPYKSSGGEIVDSEMVEIPRGWKVTTIGAEFQTILGGTPPTKNKDYWENGNVAWINSGEINKFRITEPTAYITEEAVNNSATKLMPKGTTVLAITGATLGQVSRIEIDTCANQSVIGIIENKEISSEYIYLWIKHKIIDLISHQTGGAQQHINKNNVNEMKILLPDDSLMLKFKAVINPIFKNISINCFESQNLSQIRDLLLPRLMSGKIRVPVEVN